MSNELTLSAYLRVEKGSFVFERSIQQLLATMTGNAVAHKVVSIGTSKESVGLDDVATPGYVLLLNLDAANYVVYGADADSPFGKLKAGEVALLRMAGGTLSLKADTSACLVEVVVIED